MDPVTHSLSGMIISRTGFYQRFGMPAAIIIAIAAIIPDIDHITLRLAGPLAYLKYHRGFTHSIVGSFVIAAIMAGIACSIEKVRKKMDYPTVFIISLLGIYTHIFLDLITSYGTQIFFPFNNKRYSLDLVFIIDFYFSAFMLIPLIIISLKREWAKGVAFGSISALIIYLLIAYIGRTIAIENIKVKAVKLGITIQRIEAIPLPLSPFRWSVYIEDEKRFYQFNADVLKNNSTFDSFEKRTGENGIIEKVENLEIVKTYLWFARFPVVTAKQEGGGYSIEYFDLRFDSLPPSRPFLLKLLVDKEGGLDHAELMYHTIK